MAEEQGGVPFHMAKHFYDELHSLRVAKANAWISEDYEMALDCFIQMVSYISFKLTTHESEELQKLISKANQYKLLKSRSKTQYRALAENQLREACIEIDERMSKLMFKYNMFFPKQQILGIDKINKRYNLKNDTNINV